jgi:ubiquinone/menaquinone biosynthesis C-methylase UbiE
MSYLEPIDFHRPETVALWDELPLWSAPFGAMLLERIPIRPGLVILDVGAGTGFLTVELAQRCGREARVVAVDSWPEAMARLRHKVEALGLANVDLQERDAATLDLPDASVDVILSNLGVNNFANAADVLATCARVARPGGRIYLTSNLVGHMAEFYAVFAATLQELGRTEALAALEAHVNHRATVESLRAQLERAGFEVTDVVTDSFRMRFADGTALLRHYFIRLGFVPDWRAVAEGPELDATFEALERNLNAAAQAQGELALTVPMACVAGRRRTSSPRASGAPGGQSHVRWGNRASGRQS